MEPVSRETFANDPVPDVFPPAPTASVQPMRPVSGSERLLIMDVLRGFAIFGIFMVNIVFFSEPLSAMIDPTRMADADGTSQLMHAITRSLFEFKFVSIFSLLFGAGLMMQATRAEERGSSFRALYLRRVLVLALIGLIHGLLIWYGDILFIYACTALVVMWFHWARPAVLLPMGVLLVIAGALEVTAFGSLQVIFKEAPQIGETTAIIESTSQPADGAESQSAEEEVATAPATSQAESAPAAEPLTGFARFWKAFEGSLGSSGPPNFDEAERIAYKEGPMTATLVMRAMEFLSMLMFAGLIGGFGLRVIGMFLIGMALMKLGFFSNARRKWHTWCCVIGLGLGLPAELLVVWTHHSTEYEIGWIQLGMEALHQISSFILCFGYVGTIALLVDFGVLSRLTAGLAAVGRMALSNYLAQSVIATTLMYWWGFGWFDDVSRLQQAGLVVSIFTIQILVSIVWLRVFRMGPMEWLWRSLTYLKLQPMVRRGDENSAIA